MGVEWHAAPELKQLGASLGLKGTGAMRKSQLIDAIRAAQGGGSPAPKAEAAPSEQPQQQEKRRSRDRERNDAPAAAETPVQQQPTLTESSAREADAGQVAAASNGESGDDVAARLQALEGERGRRRRNRGGSDAESGAERERCQRARCREPLRQRRR